MRRAQAVVTVGDRRDLTERLDAHTGTWITSLWVAWKAGLAGVLPSGARNPVATGGQALTGEDVTCLARDAVWVAVQSRLKITSLGWG
jgi:hypothetical protein